MDQRKFVEDSLLLEYIDPFNPMMGGKLNDSLMKAVAQQTFISSKSLIETIEKCVK